MVNELMLIVLKCGCCLLKNIMTVWR